MILMGCEGMGPKQTGGTVIGGAGGALIGSLFGSGTGRLVGVGVGAVLGSLLGSYVGKQLDDQDLAYAQDNAVHTLNRGGAEAYTWRNPKTGRYGESIVISTSPDRSCRTLRTITYDNRSIEIGRETRTYCRGKGGNWMAA